MIEGEVAGDGEEIGLEGAPGGAMDSSVYTIGWVWGHQRPGSQKPRAGNDIRSYDQEWSQQRTRRRTLITVDRGIVACRPDRQAPATLWTCSTTCP